MSRAIDADALEKEGRSLHRTIRVDKNTEEYQTKPLRQVPTIEPRKKGKWIEQDDSWDGVYYECSACGEPWTTIDGTPWDNGMNFCPHCGAEMREPEDIPMEYFESGGR